MKKVYNLFFVMVITISSFAQTHVERVLILNEGYFDYLTNEILIPVTIGAYAPSSGDYTILHTLPGVRFASDLVIYENNYYVAADNALLVFDLYTDALVMQKEIQGIRKIAISDDVIVVTRGEYLTTFDSYIHILDRNSLETIFAIPDDALPYSTEGVEIHEGKAYVAVNNGFEFGEEVGYIAVINLELQSVEEMIDLGANGINPDNLMFDGETIYTLNNKDFTGSSISSYALSSGDLSTTDLLNVSSGCGTSALFNGEIYYQEMFGTTLSKYDPVSENIISETDFGNSFYGLTFDPINNLIYTSVTDYYSFGELKVYSITGTELHSVEIGVSPGNIVLDLRTSTQVQESMLTEVEFAPNPANDFLNIQSNAPVEQVQIYELSGRLISDNVISSNQNEILLDIELASGVYIVQVLTTNGRITERLVVSK